MIFKTKIYPRSVKGKIIVKRNTKWLKYIVWGSIFFVCVFFCCPINQIPFIQEYYANRLTEVVGETELVVPSGERLMFYLSRDGRWSIVFKPARPYGSGFVGIMDMDTYNIYPLPDVPRVITYWIDEHHLLVAQTKMLRVPEMTTWSINHSRTFDNPSALNVFTGISHVFAMNTEHEGIYRIISIDPSWPYVVTVNLEKGETLDERLVDLDYTPISRQEYTIRLSGARIYSPDNNYFVSHGSYSEEDETYRPGKNSGSALIFDTETEKMVSMMYNEGRDARFLGWAPDSSGAYFRMNLGPSLYTPRRPTGSPIHKLLVPGGKPSGNSLSYMTGTPLNQP